jgi:4-hydroxythreonine-4-phosphate dehydrogenase
MVKHKKIKVGLSIGDFNGIGVEIILKSLSDNRIYDLCTPVIYGSISLLNDQLKKLKIEDLAFKSVKNADEIDANKVNVVNVWEDELDIEFGKTNKTSGKYAYLSLKSAVEDLASNKVDVLVTAPIDKSVIQSAEFDFKGHTEFLANYANEDNPLMILASEGLRVALVTGHISLSEVQSSISKELILKKLETFNRALQQDFSINRPKIALLGLNPHNGDNGLMGNEESTLIAPVVAQAQEAGILAFGPYPADGFFGSNLRTKFDGVLAMYHDQGLAPFKAIAFDRGVNFTAGLPIVRTSPDHGVACDIAGKGIASEASMREAILYAIDIYKARKDYKELTANPLEIKPNKRRE